MSLPHSPTPWTHVPKDGAPDEIHDATGDCVADVHGTGEFKAEGRANAKIMTAAAELLAACEALPDFDIDSPDAADFKDNACAFMQAMLLARAAIAKTKGA
jgi:hypothetical protein